jgi:hypothetical protein
MKPYPFVARRGLGADLERRLSLRGALRLIAGSQFNLGAGLERRLCVAGAPIWQRLNDAQLSR